MAVLWLTMIVSLMPTMPVITAMACPGLRLVSAVVSWMTFTRQQPEWRMLRAAPSKEWLRAKRLLTMSALPAEIDTPPPWVVALLLMNSLLLITILPLEDSPPPSPVAALFSKRTPFSEPSLMHTPP